MALDEKPFRITEPETYALPIVLVGNAVPTNVPTKTIGKGVTITRTGVGAYTLTFSDNPGNFLGFAGASFQDATLAGVAGLDAFPGTFTAANGSTPATLTVGVFLTTTATDLTSAMTCCLTLLFKRAFLTL